MGNFVVDIEADGPCPGLYSMISFGAVLVEDQQKTFYGKLKPISERWISENLAVSGLSREETLTFEEPQVIMKKFAEWIQTINRNGRPTFWSDNLAFDWQFINYYFHLTMNVNPFGFSGRRIGDFVCGYHKDLRFRWKHMRKTKHDHNPVNDAKGNAEVLKKYFELNNSVR